MSGKKTQTQKTQQSYNQQNDPWGPTHPGLNRIITDAGAAYDMTKDLPNYAGPNNFQTTANRWATDVSSRFANLGDDTRSALGNLNSFAGGAPAFSFSEPLYNFAGLNLRDAQGLKSDITSVAGANPQYDNYNIANAITNLSNLAPDYSAGFNSSVTGALQPIMQDFTNKVIPAIKSQQALTGGSSSRHKLQDMEAIDSLGRAIGAAVAQPALQLEGLKSGTFDTLSNLAGGDVTDLRGLLGQDWRTLVGETGSAFRQGQDLYTGYQTAAESARAGQATARDRIGADSFDSAQARTLQALGMVPGMEKSGYELALDPARTMAGAGAEQQGWNQAAINAALTQPWGPLSNYADFITNIAQLGGNQSGNMTGTTTTTTSGGGIGSIIKGLGGLAAGFGAMGFNPMALLGGGLPGASALAGSNNMLMRPW